MDHGRYLLIRAGIWLYFLLLLLEGAFRKWFLPDYSDIIFVIRDPVVLGIYLLAWIGGVFPRRPAMAAVWFMLVCSLAFSFANQVPLTVTFFGLRTNYLHVPLVFVMGAVMNRSDVIRFGKWFTIGSLPIVVLMIVQFNSPADAWVNVGSGGVTSGQLPGAMGRIRPPGPFSFIGGVVNYFTYVMAFVLYGWLHRGSMPRLFTLVGSAALLAAIPVSISRALTVALAMVALFGAAVALQDLRRLPRYVGPFIALVGAAVVATDTIYVQAFYTRWEEAEAVAGSFYSAIIGRSLEEFTAPFKIAAEAPLFGHGIGLGTIAGARLSTGAYSFLLAESELPRIVLELGPLLGFVYIAWRFWLGGLLVFRGWAEFLSCGDALAWMLTGAALMPILVGQWGGSTTLGFAVFGGGLALAALNDPATDEDRESREGAEGAA